MAQCVGYLSHRHSRLRGYDGDDDADERHSAVLHPGLALPTITKLETQSIKCVDHTQAAKFTQLCTHSIIIYHAPSDIFHCLASTHMCSAIDHFINRLCETTWSHP